MTDLNSFVVFAKVVETCSFSEAARRLQMPLSTVSRRVAELEDQLGVRLLERSTRTLRLTDIGNELYEPARRTLELRESIENIVSNNLTSVTGVLRLSAPPSISDAMLTPVICAFQESYPNVRVQTLIAERHIDHISDEIDLAFRCGALKDSSLVARKLLTYRHRLVATPAYLAKITVPQRPCDLLEHKLIAFSKGNREQEWEFSHSSSDERETISFAPHISMNDYAGLAAALLLHGGIGELPPIVLPELIAEGRLVEIMPDWQLPANDLSLVHLGNRHISRQVRLFKEFATQMVPSLFPTLSR